MVSFLASLDNWAIVSSAVGAIEYTAAMGHKRSVTTLELLVNPYLAYVFAIGSV